MKPYKGVKTCQGKDKVIKFNHETTELVKNRFRLQFVLQKEKQVLWLFFVKRPLSSSHSTSCLADKTVAVDLSVSHKNYSAVYIQL